MDPDDAVSVDGRAQSKGGALMHRLQKLMPPVMLALTAAQAAAQACGPLPTGGYGPYDYRYRRDKVGIVEQYHFTPKVEALIAGATGTIGGDLEYVLERFPNHHRALMSVFRLAARYPRGHIAGMQYPVDCYFDRGIAFSRDDTVVRTLYALHLGRTGRKEDGENQLALAATMAGDNALSHYSIGAAYLELGRHDLAAQHALRAKDLGYQRTDLIDRLREKGAWSDRPASAPTPLATASAASP